MPKSKSVPTKKKPATKQKRADKINESINMSKVCDRVGKTCKGPIEFYLLENNRTGFKINLPKRRGKKITEADEGSPTSSILMSDDFLDIMENEIKHQIIPPDRVVIKTKIDLDLAEITVDDEKYKIAKMPYASSWIYLIRVPDIEKYAKEVVNAFVLAILVDRKQEEEKEAGGEGAAGGEAEGGAAGAEDILNLGA